MKILLVNPNRYDAPPVPPLGLEYLHGVVSDTHHTPLLLDLCFAGNPEQSLKNAITEFQPDLIGFTIRQIDSALYYTNVFFLDEIKTYISIARSYNIPVVLGGVGFSIMPSEILSFMGADYGIYGPGEQAFVHLINTLESDGKPDQLINGWTPFPEKSIRSKRGYIADYKTYLQQEGTIGFRTQIGCTERCFFCVEGNKQLLFHDPESVAQELFYFKNQGYNDFHLCDSEFNINLEHSLHVCHEILSVTGPVNWSLYMKAEPISPELFDMLHKTGASLITLSIDSYKDTRDGFYKLEEFFRYAHDGGIPVIIDLSVGYPYEYIAHTKEMLDFLATQPVVSVGVNSYYRIYPYTPLFSTIKENEDLHPYLINRESGNDYIYPVFFAWFRYEDTVSILPDREKFRIEGFEKGVNYQRIK